MIRILCIDIGTSSIKAAVFNQKKVMLDETTVQLPDDCIDTPSYWLKAIEEIMEKFRLYIAKGMSKHFMIVVSGHGPSTVYVDKHNKAIHYTSWLRNEVVEIQGITSTFIPQILYVQDNMEEIYRNTAIIFPPAEFISFLLSGSKHIFIPNKNLLPYIWNKQSLLEVYLDQKKMPPPILAGKILGKAYTKWGKKLGISHALVVSGGLDYISAIIGSGNVKPQSILQRSGTSVTLNISYPTSLEKNQSQSDIRNISFNMPAFTNKYNNAGDTVPFFDMIYKKIYSYIDLEKTDYRKIISYIKKYQEHIIPHTMSAVEKIIHSGAKIDDIYTLIQSNIKKEFLGFSYIILLLELLKYSKKKIEVFSSFQDGDMINKTIVVSGGHARDETLMFLEANYLKTKIITYKPVHVELIGNLCLGLFAAFPKKPIQILSKQILFAREYSPE